MPQQQTNTLIEGRNLQGSALSPWQRIAAVLDSSQAHSMPNQYNIAVGEMPKLHVSPHHKSARRCTHAIAIEF